MYWVVSMCCLKLAVCLWLLALLLTTGVTLATDLSPCSLTFPICEMDLITEQHITGTCENYKLIFAKLLGKCLWPSKVTISSYSSYPVQLWGSEEGWGRIIRWHEVLGLSACVFPEDMHIKQTSCINAPSKGWSVALYTHQAFGQCWMLGCPRITLTCNKYLKLLLWAWWDRRCIYLFLIFPALRHYCYFMAQRRRLRLKEIKQLIQNQTVKQSPVGHLVRLMPRSLFCTAVPQQPLIPACLA